MDFGTIFNSQVDAHIFVSCFVLSGRKREKQENLPINVMISTRVCICMYVETLCSTEASIYENITRRSPR